MWCLRSGPEIGCDVLIIFPVVVWLGVLILLSSSIRISCLVLIRGTILRTISVDFFFPLPRLIQIYVRSVPDTRYIDVSASMNACAVGVVRGHPWQLYVRLSLEVTGRLSDGRSRQHC